MEPRELLQLMESRALVAVKGVGENSIGTIEGREQWISLGLDFCMCLHGCTCTLATILNAKIFGLVQTRQTVLYYHALTSSD